MRSASTSEFLGDREGGRCAVVSPHPAVDAVRQIFTFPLQATVVLAVFRIKITIAANALLHVGQVGSPLNGRKLV